MYIYNIHKYIFYIYIYIYIYTYTYYTLWMHMRANSEDAMASFQKFNMLSDM